MKKRQMCEAVLRDLPDALYTALVDDLHGLADENPPAPDCTPREFAAKSMLQSFYKKFVGATSAQADAAALEKFLRVNSDCRSWELSLNTSADEELYGEFKYSIYKFFEPGGYPLVTSLREILSHGRVGPGASVAARGYDFYTKLFSSPLSTTSSILYDEYRSYAWNFPEWSGAELIRKAEFGGPDIVSGNRLSFVPKTVDISRTISIEPSLNMFYQLGLKEILERRLCQSFGIDLATQQGKNRELARVGSLDDGPDSFVTIDLSSASDSMSLRMLRAALPRHIMALLESLRSPTCTLPDGSQVELGMVSTMGNGFTFPLQTILFSCVVIAAARVAERSLHFPYGKSLGTFGVNGDDIVCAKNIARHVIRLLTILGFEVNSSKTFVEGPFRESCGHDYYHGFNVRGVYVKTLSDAGSRYALINALNLWSARTGILLVRTVQKLASTVRYLPVPLWENPESGIKVPFFIARPHIKRHKGYQSILYECMVPRRCEIVVSSRGRFPTRGSQRSRIYNPPGLLMAVLNGSIRSGKIGVRHDTKQYQTKRRIAPNWDYSETSADVASAERTGVWEDSAVLNLGLEYPSGPLL